MRKLLAVVLLATAVLGAWAVPSPGKRPQTQYPSTLSVTVVSPHRANVTEYLDVTGTTVARDQVQILAELTGLRVKELYADVGDEVRKGQRLAALDGEAQKIREAQLRAEYERAADAFQRVDALRVAGAISPQKVVEARTAMQSAKAQLDDTRLSVRRAVVITPAAGIVTERKAELGALVGVDEPLYRIAKDGEIEVEADVPEAELGKIAVGGSVRIQVVGVPEAIDGVVRLITPRIDPTTRSAKVRLALVVPRRFAVGLFAAVRIAARAVDGLALPATAVQVDDKGSFVWKLDIRNRVERLTVAVVVRRGQQVIVADVPTQSRIVARAGSLLNEGDTVNVVQVLK